MNLVTLPTLKRPKRAQSASDMVVSNTRELSDIYRGAMRHRSAPTMTVLPKLHLNNRSVNVDSVAEQEDAQHPVESLKQELLTSPDCLRLVDRAVFCE